MRINIQGCLDFMPLVAALDYCTNASTLEQAEDTFCRLVGDEHFRMTNPTQHHTHYYARSIDACVGLLGRHTPWLVPRLDYSERSAQLVNGIGRPMNSNPRVQRADTMPLALMLAILDDYADMAQRNPEYQHDHPLHTGQAVTA